MKKVLFILGVLLSFELFCACSSGDETDSSPLERDDHTSRSEEKTDSIELESCISGKIIIYEEDDPVFIGYLTMPEGDNDKYNFIGTVVIPKDEFPLQDYQDGDIIDFNIVEVKSPYPEIQIGVFPPTAFLCSIKLCK